MSRLTKLQATNLVLSAAGLAPVNTIDTPTNLDAALVVQLIDAVHRETLYVGWNFNTEYEVSLEVDINTGKIPLGTSIIRCEIPDMPWIIQRGAFLYDRSAKSDQFEDAVTAKVIKHLVWDELHEEVKTLIYKTAAVRFAATHKPPGDVSLQLLAQDALIAESHMKERDADEANYSIFDDPATSMGVPVGHEYMPGAPRHGYDYTFDRTPKFP